MTIIELDWLDLGLAFLLVIALVGLLAAYRLGVSRLLLIASLRMCVQLALIGYVLKFLFDEGRLLYILLMSLVMLAVAGYEIVARQKRRLKGWKAYRTGVASMFVASFAVTLYGLFVVVKPDPWYVPQYFIPLLGMIMSNTMTGISLCIDRLTTTLYDQRAIVEQRLALGQSASEAIKGYAHDCYRSGMMPVINSMMTAGVVALPGMMTGQILAGASPFEAVKYQMMIWFFIAAGSGFGMAMALRLAKKQLFDDRERLRLDRLVTPTHSESLLPRIRIFREK